MRRSLLSLALLLLLVPLAKPAAAQLLQTSAISLEAAKGMAAAAEAEARRLNVNAVITIVDASGTQILFHRMDGSPGVSVGAALGKARTAASFGSPTGGLQAAVAANPALMALEGIMPLEGGLPIRSGNRVIGAIGVSGGSLTQDGQMAQAGLNALGS